MTIIEYATDILGLQLTHTQITILNEYQKAYDGNYKVRVCDSRRNGKQATLMIIDEFEIFNKEKNNA